MSGNMPSRDIRTRGYVLRRTNYGEADRILNLITPEGKITVVAKGVRKPRSKLAGGVEMFTLADYNVHMGRGEFGTLTGAKMVRYYGGIVRDLELMELASVILKRVSMAAESSDSAEYFELVDMGLRALDIGVDAGIVEGWFWLNLMRVMGEEVNLYRDTNGEVLVVEGRYSWDVGESTFVMNMRGEYGANEIKMLRLMLTNDLNVVQRIKVDGAIIGKVLRLARTVARA